MSMMSYTDGRNIIFGIFSYLRGAVSDYKVILYLLLHTGRAFLTPIQQKTTRTPILNA